MYFIKVNWKNDIPNMLTNSQINTANKQLYKEKCQTT